MKISKWVVIPQDVLDRLTDVHSTQESAQQSALDRCGETGMRMSVVEIQTVAVREHPPVKLRRVK